MTFEIIKGDLFDPAHNFEALAQGVNTKGLMGAGIAVEFKNRFPDMYDDYVHRCTQFGEALGGLVHAYHPEVKEYSFKADGYGSFDCIHKFDDPIIFNMFSQIMPGRNGDYRLLQQSAIQVLFDAEECEVERLGLPWIGCGIAGLERHNVAHIFKQVFGSSDVEFVLVEQ
jgi:O-acetyl-ADP-ribose deacetylase (regulator of RNase III)